MVAEYLGAVKLAFDTLRSGLGIVKDVKDALPTDEQRHALEFAVEKSEQQFQIAEAQMAQALGYQLCKCEFPPTIMLAVGTTNPRGNEKPTPVYECPKCGADTVFPYGFNRNKTLANTRTK